MEDMFVVEDDEGHPILAYDPDEGAGNGDIYMDESRGKEALDYITELEDLSYEAGIDGWQQIAETATEQETLIDAVATLWEEGFIVRPMDSLLEESPASEKDIKVRHAFTEPVGINYGEITSAYIP